MKFLPLTLAVLLVIGGQLSPALGTAPPPPPFTGHFYWPTEAWTQSDKPYQVIRRQVDSYVKAGKDIKNLLNRYQAESKHDPYNNILLFRWGYAAYLISKVHPHTVDIQASADALNWMNKMEPRAGSYEFTRLRYLISAQQHIGDEYNKDLFPLGERLEKRNPNDKPINEVLFSRRLWNPHVEQRRKAVRYAESRLKAFPQKAWPYGYIGAAYNNLWWMTNDPKDGDRALWAYRTYLQKENPKIPFTKEVPGIINEILGDRDATGRYRKAASYAKDMKEFIAKEHRS